MNQMQVFEFENDAVRTLPVNDEPQFVGKDVAEVLGYKRPADAIQAHVDPEDKGVGEIQTPGGIQRMITINESGLYALIFGSHLDKAKRFKRWVTSEVLPEIRKTGSYVTPKSPMEILELQFEALRDTTKRVNRAVSETIDNLGLAHTQKVRNLLFKDINSGVNAIAGIKTRTQLRQKHFNDVIEFIDQWAPSTAALMQAKQMTADLEEDEQ